MRLEAVSSFGDPVDLADESALELAEALLRLYRTPHAPADHREAGRRDRVTAVLAARSPAVHTAAVFVIDEDVWLWSDGCVCVKAVKPSGDSVLLSGEAVLELVEAPVRLVRAPRLTSGAT